MLKVSLLQIGCSLLSLSLNLNLGSYLQFFHVHMPKYSSSNNVDLFPEGVAEADLVLLVTTRPTTGNTLAWAVACERDQWGRAIAGIYSFIEHCHILA